eukprot:11181248-Lingulodinium_polyedra.AAC.1
MTTRARFAASRLTAAKLSARHLGLKYHSVAEPSPGVKRPTHVSKTSSEITLRRRLSVPNWKANAN